MSDGFTENARIDEGVNEVGVRTVLSFEGDQLIVTKSWDGKGAAEQCKAERLATSGERWGEMRKVGYIGPIEYARLCQIKDNKERIKAMRLYLQANPDFITFDRYMK